MGSAINVPDAALVGRLTHGFFDDFDHFVTADRWTVTASNSGGATVADGAGGIITLDASDSTEGDNDETYLLATTETLKFAANKPITLAASVQFTEANTNDANVAVGYADGVAADTILDDGAGLKATFDGAVIYKVDGGTVWRFITSNGTTRTDSVSTTTAGGSAYQVLEIETRHQSATEVSLIPKVDGVQLKDSNGNLIEHKVLYASATEMQAFAGVKNGGANEETLNVDYISCWQKR